MKKTFLARRNALFSSAGVSWGAYALAASVLLLLVRLLAPNFFLHLFTPAFRGADFVTAQSHALFSGFNDTARLALENERLLRENAALTNENQVLKQKEASLAALSGGDRPAPEILAGVVARPPESPYDTLVLAEGGSAGIAPGMEVFAEGGVPIGVISSVLPDFARATLFSSSGMHTSGWVGGANIPLTIIGAGAGSMSAVLPRSASVAVGDTVSVPGPGALPLGTVVRIDSDPSSPSITLHIQSALNLFSVTWVAVRDTGAALLTPLPQTTLTPP